ncbi:MAG TPA: 3'-5' exonuclease [Stenomitos sp.]
MSTFIALDFETANRSRTSACSIGLIRVEDRCIVQQEHFLIQPPEPDFEFTYIHGICWEDVAHAPTFDAVWPHIATLIDGVDFIAAHNASFDKGVLYACCDRHNIPRPPHPFICTVQLARKTWKLHPTKLPNVCQFLGVELNHHDALSDAHACAQIVIAAAQSSPNPVR